MREIGNVTKGLEITVEFAVKPEFMDGKRGVLVPSKSTLLYSELYQFTPHCGDPCSPLTLWGLTYRATKDQSPTYHIKQTVMQRYDVCQCVWQSLSRKTHFHSNSSWTSRPETNKKSLASLLNSDQLLPAGKHCRIEYWTFVVWLSCTGFSVMFTYFYIRH